MGTVKEYLAVIFSEVAKKERQKTRKSSGHSYELVEWLLVQCGSTSTERCKAKRAEASLNCQIRTPKMTMIQYSTEAV